MQDVVEESAMARVFGRAGDGPDFD
jgi:hypothetical protein